MKISAVRTGMIATEIILLLKTEAKGIEVTSIFSHSNEEKAELLTKMNHIGRIYTDYTQLLKEDKADFVHIALANNAHYEFTRMTLEAGRNAVVEKPFTLTVAEAEEIVAMARERKPYLFEAISPLHIPNFRMVRDSLKKTGLIHFMQCNFSQCSSKFERYLQGDITPAFNPELGDGALNDLNVYNINVAIDLFGQPTATQYFTSRGHSGIDTSGIVVLSYPTMAATCTAVKDSNSPSFILIQREKGWIHIPTPASESGGMEMMKQGKSTSYRRNTYESRLAHELIDFKDVWEKEDYKQMEAWLDRSVEVMRVLR